MTATRVFDGHNDVLSKLHGSRPDDPADAFIDGYDAAIDLPKSVEGGFAGGFFAVYVPPLEVDHEARLAAMTAESYALPLPRNWNSHTRQRWPTPRSASCGSSRHGRHSKSAVQPAKSASP